MHFSCKEDYVGSNPTVNSMNIKEIRDKIDNLEQQKDKLEDEVKKIVKDKTIPLLERWNLFCFAKMGNYDSDYLEYRTLYKIFDDFDWHDHLYVDRYQTIKTTDIISRLDPDVPKELVEELMEEILDKFVWSFTHDW